MISQPSQQTRDRSDEFILGHLLKNIDRDRIHLLDAQVLVHSRNSPDLTGENLLKQCVKREAERLLVQEYHVIDLATKKIWEEFSFHQRRPFDDLANEIKNMNRILDNKDTIDRISLIPTHQVTNNPLQDDFLNGTSFFGSNSSHEVIFPNRTSII